jgi:protein SCO1/2
MPKGTLVVTLTLAVGVGAVASIRHFREAADGTRLLPVTGTVVAPPDGRTVRVAHEAIPGYMPAMTMAFTLGDREAASLAAGDRVRFTLRVGDGATRMEGVTVIDRAVAAELPRAGTSRVVRLKRGDTIPGFALVDEGGRSFTDADLRGHATVLTFIFTRCPVPEFCPLVTSRFKELQAALARGRSASRSARLVSVTIDPLFDTPAVLRDYARAVQADAKIWRFASGDPEEIQRLARAFSVYVEQNGALLDHTLATALVDADGRVVEIWRGNGWKASEVLAALEERSQPVKLAVR